MIKLALTSETKKEKNVNKILTMNTTKRFSIKSFTKKVSLKLSFKNINSPSCPQVFRKAVPQVRTIKTKRSFFICFSPCFGNK